MSKSRFRPILLAFLTNFAGFLPILLETSSPLKIRVGARAYAHPAPYCLFFKMIDDDAPARNHQIRIFQQLEATERIALHRNQIGWRIHL